MKCYTYLISSSTNAFTVPGAPGGMMFRNRLVTFIVRHSAKEEVWISVDIGQQDVL
jgi:hypothetical protein